MLSNIFLIDIYQCLYFYKLNNLNMNYLAHLYFSGNNKDIKLGNFFADWIKGKEQNWNPNFNSNIKKGITMHRFIDSYTDNNVSISNMANKFHTEYHHYSKIVTDILLDHFLAKNWFLFSDIELDKFTFDFYKILISNFFILPKQVKIFLPFMISSNRLSSYKTLEGIQKTLEIMSRNTSLPAKTNFAIDIIKNNYDNFESESIIFLKVLKIEIENRFFC